MHTCEQWQLHCTSQWGWYMPLSEHVYCVAVTIKMTEQVEQWICIKFCSSVKTIQMIQKATAMGNWWLAASSEQCTHSHITSRAEFFGETSNHPGDSALLQPRFGALRLLTFPKTKITFERDFRLLMRFRKIRWGSWWWLGELCEAPRCACFEGD